jgi:hypothetical protein
LFRPGGPEGSIETDRKRFDRKWVLQASGDLETNESGLLKATRYNSFKRRRMSSFFAINRAGGVDLLRLLLFVEFVLNGAASDDGHDDHDDDRSNSSNTNKENISKKRPLGKEKRGKRDGERRNRKQNERKRERSTSRLPQCRRL